MQVYSCISSESLNRLWSTIDDTSLYSGKKKPRVDFRSCGRYAGTPPPTATSIRKLKNGLGYERETRLTVGRVKP